MVMTDKHANDRLDDLALEAFFAAGREAAPEPGVAFLARIAAQGEAVQAERMSAALAPPVRRDGAPRGGLFAALAAAVGGWGAFGGMATAALAGLWIGFAGSETLAQVAGFATTGPVQAVSSTDTGSAFLPEADILALAAGQ